MGKLCRASKSIVGVFVVVLAFHASSASGGTFTLTHGNAAILVVIPKVNRAILESVSAGGNDASIVLRITTLLSNSWFDAIAPYHPTAVGVYSRLGRRPAIESITNLHKNIAILYASYRVLNSLLPKHAADWRDMLKSVGLDPDDDQENTTSAVGIGNKAGKAVVAAREHDGMNQLGDEGGRKYNRQPYADYLGYQPVNTAYELLDPSRWQPNIVTRGNGLFQVQQFVTPQWRVTRPYSYESPDAFLAPPPVASNPESEGYKAQADEVLALSAGLTDHQKIISEFFDNKLRSLGPSVLFISLTRKFNLHEFVHYHFVTHVATFDAGIATWNEKFRYDAVRPFSAIRFLYGNSPVTAWGGPGKGTVSDLPASEWRSYMNTADHPEYPSGSACFCAAHAQASRRFLGSDALGWFVPIPRGSSGIEPGITPAGPIILGPWNTWTEFETDCGLARLWGGVHFQAAVTAGHDLCQPIGDLAHDFVRAHIDGTVPASK